jgi:glycosyltransferase involved in cell wall biosynthesis
VRLVIVHYHLRPGGIRRVIELATPHLLRALPQVNSVVLASGEANDPKWNQNLARLVAPVPLSFVTEPGLGYVSEQHAPIALLREQISRAVRHLLNDATARNCIVWAHNLGIGRNILLAEELARACAERRVPLISHHHDWWFDNRWWRWSEIRSSGYATPAAVARAIFPALPAVRHATINHEDANVLAPRFRRSAAWLPNLAARDETPAPARVTAARRWLDRRLGERNAPIWILPCRLLRRKNIAEAVLLTRWLRPEAWLVTTGGASSADEQPYYRKLEHAARQNDWRVQLGVLRGEGKNYPSVSELLAASEAVLLTSIQEGFGLPYLEAAAAARPLLARQLPNIAPDLARFGFRFPQAYEEILVAPELFDWRAERRRQQKLFTWWEGSLPRPFRSIAGKPVLLQTAPPPDGVPFSRLTLTAQLEVLEVPVAESWQLCAPLNPFLVRWRRRAQQQTLQSSPWPRTAHRWLSGAAYARRFVKLALSPPRPGVFPDAAEVQTAFLEKKLCSSNLYPLLWATET